MRTKIALGCFLPIALYAQVQIEPPKLKTEDSAKTLIENCLKQFIAGNYKDGFDSLKPHWKVSTSEIDTLIMQTITTRIAVKERYGNSIGYEFISEQHSGKSFLKFIAVEKLQNTAIRYQVVFYKPEDSWVLQTFLWDDKVQLLFGE